MKHINAWTITWGLDVEKFQKYQNYKTIFIIRKYFMFHSQ